MNKILIVDDAEFNREVLKTIFEEEYELIECADGVEACEAIDRYGKELSLILLDILMPRKNGYEVLEYIQKVNLTNYVPVIVLTGESADEADLKVYEFGADDVIHKPFATTVVKRRSMNLMEQFKIRNDMESELIKRTAELIENQKEMARINERLLNALGSVVEFRSLESGIHVKRVVFFTKIMLDCIKERYPEYELSTDQIDLMARAAALHDVGKIAISDKILNAPRKLTYDEFEAMKEHTIFGCEILERFKFVDNDFFEYCYKICRWHHEKVDGRGYPDGLVGDEIPIYCQAASIADCFDALISRRVYKDAEQREIAFEMILNGECGAFSDKVIDCFKASKNKLFDTVDTVDSEMLLDSFFD